MTEKGTAQQRVGNRERAESPRPLLAALGEGLGWVTIVASLIWTLVSGVWPLLVGVPVGASIVMLARVYADVAVLAKSEETPEPTELLRAIDRMHAAGRHEQVRRLAPRLEEIQRALDRRIENLQSERRRVEELRREYGE